MFGYVKAYKPELTLREYDTYKAVYCSLCKQLGKSYGPFSKMILSYDYTFLVLLRLGLQEQCCGYRNMRCSFNPLHKCNGLKDPGEEMEYAAACAVVMFYYKLRDNIKDSGFFGRLKARLIYPVFAHARKKAAKRYAALDTAVNRMMCKQQALEGQNTASFDAAAEPTATLLSEIFVRDEPEGARARVLRRLGYCLGKWIYLCDALDDLDDDLKSGNYNPIAVHFSLQRTSEASRIAAAKEDIRALVNVCTAETAAALELLELKRYQTILSNIVYLGMPNTVKIITKSMEE